MYHLKLAMDKHVAEKIMNALVEASSAIAVTVEDLRGLVSDDYFKRHSKFVGEILASIQLDLMATIIREHPDLDPDR